MVATIVIAVITCLGLVLCVLIKPEIGIKKITLRTALTEYSARAPSIP